MEVCRLTPDCYPQFPLSSSFPPQKKSFFFFSPSIDLHIDILLLFYSPNSRPLKTPTSDSFRYLNEEPPILSSCEFEEEEKKIEAWVFNIDHPPAPLTEKNRSCFQIIFFGGGAAFLKRDGERIFFFLSQLVVFIFLWQLGGGKYTVGPSAVAGVAFGGQLSGAASRFLKAAREIVSKRK